MTDACGTLATLAALHRLRVIRCTGATLSPTERYAALGLVEDSHRHVLRKSAGQAYVAAQGMRPELESASTAIVALFRGERLVGFVAHRCSNEETLHVRYLLELHLLERFRRRGLGRALVEEARAVGEQAGACGIMLTCDARNRPAMQFYAEIGFVRSPCSPSVLLTRQATERMRDEDGNEHELLVLLWGEGSFDTLLARAGEAAADLQRVAVAVGGKRPAPPIKVSQGDGAEVDETCPRQAGDRPRGGVGQSCAAQGAAPPLKAIKRAVEGENAGGGGERALATREQPLC
jgi:GNAT superfamily N-acetyltransferase